MPSATCRWLVFAAIIVAGVTLGIVVDFIVHHPELMLSMVLLAYVFTRPHLPMTYTCVVLDRYHNAVAYTLAQLYVPIALVGGVVALTWRHWSSLGPAHAFGSALLAVYVLDRLTAFAIRHTVVAWQKARAAESAAAGDDVVDAEVLP